MPKSFVVVCFLNSGKLFFSPLLNARVVKLIIARMLQPRGCNRNRKTMCYSGWSHQNQRYSLCFSTLSSSSSKPATVSICITHNAARPPQIQSEI